MDNIQNFKDNMIYKQIIITIKKNKKNGNVKLDKNYILSLSIFDL